MTFKRSFYISFLFIDESVPIASSLVEDESYWDASECVMSLMPQMAKYLMALVQKFVTYC